MIREREEKKEKIRLVEKRMWKFSQVITGRPNPDRYEINAAIIGITIRGLKGTYVLENFLGTGSFGDVFKVSIMNTSQDFALKIAPYDNRSLLEAEAYNRLRDCGENVVCAYDIFIYTEKDGRKWLVIVQELLDIDLFDYRPKSHEMSTIIMDLLSGVSCINSKGIAHKDIKAENMFMVKRERKIFKIGDPGLVCSRITSPEKYTSIKTCTMTGTYLPPDLVKTKEISDPIDFPTALSIDSWDLGLYFYQALVLMGFLDRSTLDMMRTKYNGNFPPDYKIPVELPNNVDFGKISPEVISNILKYLLTYDSEKRPTAHETLKYIVLKMGWAEPGQEDTYLEKNTKTSTCSAELSPIVHSIVTPPISPPSSREISPEPSPEPSREASPETSREASPEPEIQTTAIPGRILKPIYRLPKV